MKKELKYNKQRGIKMDYIKKNFADTLILVSIIKQKENDADLTVATVDFIMKNKKHFKRTTFQKALAKKANALKNKVSKDILEKSNHARSIYN
jgi:hypothetical protein|tara:strand:- start:247 stop:525 length:279 start_codon:yes stop_codon:yes gene_type:complete